MGARRAPELPRDGPGPGHSRRSSTSAFVGCKLDDTNLRFARAERLRFDDCSLVGADCYEATLTGTEFEACDLTNAEFSKATMVGARLAGSTLERVRGASSLAGAIVTTDQVLPLALGVFADLGIVVERPDDDRVLRRGTRPSTSSAQREIPPRERAFGLRTTSRPIDSPSGPCKPIR